MNKQFLKVAVPVVVLCGLFFTSSLFVGDSKAFSVAWDDSDYFAAVYACDGNYSETLDGCRANPSYPTNPDESQCRFNAGSSYVDCLWAIPGPTYELDFCAMARAARDNCVNVYGPNSANPDLSAYGACRDASGVDQCE